MRPFLTLFFVFVCLNPLRVFADYPTLRASIDPVLQTQLGTVLDKQRLSGAVQRGELAVVLADITDPDQPRVASINGEQMLYAASLPKIAILLGAFEEIEQQRLTLDDSTEQRLAAMIRHSSNRAATEILNEVGKPRLAEILQSPRYRLYDVAQNGGLWVGKDYARANTWRRDPLHNLSHGATALQVARFYYLLQTGRLVSPEASLKMKSLLSEPGIKHKFVKGMIDLPDARLYRKSGTWRNWHADSALVERAGRRYIAVALSHHRDGGRWLSQLIRPMDSLITRSTTASIAASAEQSLRDHRL